jgi:hypothetical protein
MMKKLPFLIAVTTLFSLHLTAYAEENAAKPMATTEAKPVVTEEVMMTAADVKPAETVPAAADGEKKPDANAPAAEGEKKAKDDEPDCN